MFVWEVLTPRVPLDALGSLYNRFMTAKVTSNSGKKRHRIAIVFSKAEIEAYTQAIDRVLRLREPEFGKLPLRNRVVEKKV